uniref:GBD/FH3 domain-containing protein n=1 Tax=Panagrellus redivivus TaxID=6233 RepID=A0A7E4VZU6_PANRE
MVLIELPASRNGTLEAKANGHAPPPESLGMTLPSMPSEEEVLRAFDDVLKHMDLPPDKLRALRDCALKKKWMLVCDQRSISQVTEPEVYLEKLRACYDKKLQKKLKKTIGNETSTTILKHIEISLRTNSIDWVQKFLNAENDGLRVIVDCLTQCQNSFSSFAEVPSSFASSSLGCLNENSVLADSSSTSGGLPEDTRWYKRQALSSSKPGKGNKVLGDVEEDIHVCVACLRAIMNNKHGFNKVFNDDEAIYCIARSILHPSLKTKASVIELLSAICLVKDGHELIVKAFNRFRDEYRETVRFKTLFHFFRFPHEFNVEFMAASMQLINVLVHSVDDFNYRVFLQHEFYLLGLDEYLDLLADEPSEPLQTQRQSYIGNIIDVRSLVQTSRENVVLRENCESLQTSLSQARETIQQAHVEYVSCKTRLERQMDEIRTEQKAIVQLHQIELNTKNAELQATKANLSNLQLRLEEISAVKKSMEQELRAVQAKPAPITPTVVRTSSPTAVEQPNIPAVSSKAPPPPPPPPPSAIAPIRGGPPPPPPPPPGGPPNLKAGPGGPPPPPPPIGGLNLKATANGLPPADCKTLRRVIQPKTKLPQLTWSALKPNEVKGTVFMDLNDEKLQDTVDFSFLEENFKLNLGPTTSADSTEQHSPVPSVNSVPAKESTTTLLSSKRLQNVAITRRKIARSADELMMAVHRFDISLLPAELVDILIPVLPSTEEIQMYNEYSAQNNGSFEGLSLEDQFVASLVGIERLQFKLKVMSFMASFDESSRLIKPSLMSLTAASTALKEAKKFHKVLEVILLFGNFLNGHRKGSVYGFKISSLDTLRVMRSSSDHKLTLLHAIVQAITDKYPDLLNFDESLKVLERASQVNLESIQTDVRELENMFKQAAREKEQKGSDCPEALATFVDKASTTMTELQTELNLASETFKEVVEFFGENYRKQQPNVFFTYVVNFCKNFRKAAVELKERSQALARKAEEKNHQANSPRRNGAGGTKSTALMSELNARINRSAKLTSSDIDDGDFERIVNNLKGGYIASDGPPVPPKRTRKSPSPSRRHVSRVVPQLVDRERVQA